MGITTTLSLEKTLLNLKAFPVSIFYLFVVYDFKRWKFFMIQVFILIYVAGFISILILLSSFL